MEVWNPSLSAAVAFSICGEMKVSHRQGGHRLKPTAMRKLISVKYAEWEKINGVEVSSSYSGTYCISFYNQL